MGVCVFSMSVVSGLQHRLFPDVVRSWQLRVTGKTKFTLLCRINHPNKYINKKWRSKSSYELSLLDIKIGKHAHHVKLYSYGTCIHSETYKCYLCCTSIGYSKRSPWLMSILFHFGLTKAKLSKKSKEFPSRWELLPKKIMKEKKCQMWGEWFAGRI